MSLRVDIGVFAHDEAAGIVAVLQGLRAQDIFAGGWQVRLLVLANGCSDDTAGLAGAVPGVEVVDLAQGGKSRTWNRFVHDIAAHDADVLIFADADILLPRPDVLRQLVHGLLANPTLHVISSQPVKDITENQRGLTVTERMIAASAGGLDDWKSAICGQLYAMPAARARAHHLPVGLPVEDGFLRAMVLTDHLTQGEDLTRIGGADGVRHIYQSERRLGALIRHQIRIVIGSAVNAAVFSALRRLPPEDRAEELATSARDDGWLPAVLRAEIPRWPYGFVPAHFLFKRLARIFAPGRRLGLRPIGLAIIGFFFDAIVYAGAQIKMLRGTGAGHW